MQMHMLNVKENKVKGAFQSIVVPQPSLVRYYDMNMSSVDKSDQLIGKYNSLRKTPRFWKTFTLLILPE